MGLVTGTCMAELGNKVICVDSDEERIRQLNKNVMPIYEPGLSELVETNIQAGRLSFATNLKDAVEKSEIIFIAVGTPLKDDGSPDLSQIEQAGKQIAGYINRYKIIVVRSTVPVGITHKLKILMSIVSKHEFDIASNPEFLKEGTAIDDFLKPDRIVLGVESDRARQKLLELYEPFDKAGRHIYTMDKFGYNKSRLTYEGSYNTSPSWSPDGKLVVYSGWQDGKNHVFTIRADGRGLRQLTVDGNNEEPSFSPDGRFIVFTSDRRGSKAVYVMRSGGEDQRMITTPGLKTFSPRWSPK